MSQTLSAKRKFPQSEKKKSKNTNISDCTEEHPSLLNAFSFFFVQKNVFLLDMFSILKHLVHRHELLSLLSTLLEYVQQMLLVDDHVWTRFRWYCWHTRDRKSFIHILQRCMKLFSQPIEFYHCYHRVVERVELSSGYFINCYIVCGGWTFSAHLLCSQ